jgi:hypothetical protein
MVLIMSKKPNSYLAIGLAAVAGSLALSSCADPYGGGGYASGGYASGGYPAGGYASSGYGYGQGYGYGGSSFSTTTFIATSSPRWGYDPSVRAYYDYNRRAYYDPYLYGYYPIGYRPVVVYGAPHPYGWRPGYNRIAPPSRVTSITLSNYDRRSAYRSSDYSWARQVEAAPAPRRDSRQYDSRQYESRQYDSRDHRSSYPSGSQPRQGYPQTYQGERNAPLDPRYSTGTQGRPSSQGRVTATTQQPYVQSAKPEDGRAQGSGVASRRVVTPPTQAASGGVGRPTSKPDKALRPSNRGTQTAEDALEEARRNGAPAPAYGTAR